MHPASRFGAWTRAGFTKIVTAAVAYFILATSVLAGDPSAVGAKAAVVEPVSKRAVGDDWSVAYAGVAGSQPTGSNAWYDSKQGAFDESADWENTQGHLAVGHNFQRGQRV